MVDLDKFPNALRRLWTHGNSKVPGLIDGTIAAAHAVFEKYGLTSDLVVCHAMAQFSEECGAGIEMRENMNYSAARLLQVFPTHFTHNQAIALQHNPREIANQAYGQRMGNRPGTDDGWIYRGGGFAQTTGRGVHEPPKNDLEGYAELARVTGLDLLNHPELVASPDHALECGVADFVACGCLPYAEKDDMIGVASMLNVGHYVSNPNKINGYHMRENWLSLWKHAMGV